MINILFSESEKEKINYLRYHHPHPRVRIKMEVLWLKSQNLPHQQIANLAGVSKNTIRNYFKQYLSGGIERVEKFEVHKHQTELIKFQKIISEEFKKQPPSTVKEAASTIEKITGLKRSTTQVRKFLITIGMSVKKVGYIPGKADPDVQELFKKKDLLPRLKEAREGARAVFFVDASHFVMGAFLGFVWCFKRVFIKSNSGRKRFNVLGALNAITHEIITVTNDSYINAESVCQLLEEIRNRLTDIPITLVLDNARYQKCKLVKERANNLNIELLYLPTYSPNLNLIERLWKWVKKTCLYSKYYEDFDSFKTAINSTIERAHIEHKKELKSLLTLKFQIIDKAQILNC